MSAPDPAPIARNSGVDRLEGYRAQGQAQAIKTCPGCGRALQTAACRKCAKWGVNVEYVRAADHRGAVEENERLREAISQAQAVLIDGGTRGTPDTARVRALDILGWPTGGR